MITQNSSDAADLKNKLFSHYFFDAQRISSIGQNGGCPKGRGPFLRILEGTKYDLLCSQNGHLLGHSHPLLLKSLMTSMEYGIHKCPSEHILSREIQEIKNRILSLFGDSKMKHVLLFSSLDALFGDLFQYGDSVLLLGEAPKEYGHHLHFVAFDEKKPSATLINLNSQSEPTHSIKEDRTLTQAMELSRKNNIPVICTEHLHWGCRPEGMIPLTKRILKDVDIYIIGNNLPLFAAVSQKPILLCKKPSLYTTDIIMANKMLRFLQEGNFYGSSGRIGNIENKIRQRFNKTHEKFSYLLSGLILSIIFPETMQNHIKRIHQTLFQKGIISEYSSHKIHFYFPLTITDNHIHDIHRITEESILEIMDEPCST